MSATALAIDYFDQKTNHAFHVPVDFLKIPKNDRQYRKIEKFLDTLIDEVKDNETHPMVDIMEIIGSHLELYDNKHHPAIGEKLSNIEMVKYLMESHGLVQKDLAPIFGSQGNVSLFLSGKRPLGRNQIIKLKDRFGVSADLFLSLEKAL